MTEVVQHWTRRRTSCRYTFGGGEPLLPGRSPARSSSCPPRTASAAGCAAVDDLPPRGLRVPVPQPGDRPVPRRGRRARRHPGRALRRRSSRPATGRSPRTFPHFGALTATHATAMLHAAARGASSGSTRSTRPRGTVPLPRPPRRLRPSSCRWTRCTARSGWRPAAGEVLHDDHPGRARREHGHPGAAGRRHRVLRGQRAGRRCSRSATGTAGRARARSAAPRSRRR